MCCICSSLLCLVSTTCYSSQIFQVNDPVVLLYNLELLKVQSDQAWSYVTQRKSLTKKSIQSINQSWAVLYLLERKDSRKKKSSAKNVIDRKSARKKICSKQILLERKSSWKKIFSKENLFERRSSRKKSRGYFIKPTVDDLSVLLLPTISSLLSGNQPCLVTTSKAAAGWYCWYSSQERS